MESFRPLGRLDQTGGSIGLLHVIRQSSDYILRVRNLFPDGITRVIDVELVTPEPLLYLGPTPGSLRHKS